MSLEDIFSEPSVWMVYSIYVFNLTPLWIRIYGIFRIWIRIQTGKYGRQKVSAWRRKYTIQRLGSLKMSSSDINFF